MNQFLGTHQNKIDAKGRVSIPAGFRNVLRAPQFRAAGGEGPCRVVLRPSHNHRCIEAWPEPAFEALAQPLEGVPLFSEDHDDLSASLFADAQAVESDREGRIVVPETIARHAGLTDAVVFMGMGRIFHIWEPDAAEAFRAAARARTQQRGLTLPGNPARVATPLAAPAVRATPA